jgi:hypothetical protein
MSLASLHATPAERADAATTVIGAVDSIAHPVLEHHVRVSWTTTDGAAHARWLPVLQGLVVRSGDRVLVTRPDNADTPVVTGVLDGVRPRRDPPRERGPELRLEADEALRICGPDGTAWLEVQATDAGPRVSLLVSPEGFEVPGALRFSGESVELEARTGEVRVKAHGDVRIDGEMVHLNGGTER